MKRKAMTKEHKEWSLNRSIDIGSEAVKTMENYFNNKTSIPIISRELREAWLDISGSFDSLCKLSKTLK